MTSTGKPEAGATIVPSISTLSNITNNSRPATQLGVDTTTTTHQQQVSRPVSPALSFQPSISKEDPLLPSEDDKSPVTACRAVLPPPRYQQDPTHDLEAAQCPSHFFPTGCPDKMHVDDPALWPSKALLMEKCRAAKAAQRARHPWRTWNPLRGLTKRQRLLVKVCIGLLIVGAAIAIGIGISIAVGGKVYKGDGRKEEIPGSNDR